MWGKLVLVLQCSALAAATTDCYMHDTDVGGGQNVCGYMDHVAMLAPPGVAKPSWFNAYFHTVSAEEIDSPEKCQAYCEHMPNCDYFSFSGEHTCLLKHDYHNASCTPLTEPNPGLTSGPKRCDSCIHPHEDVGGSFNPCGFMDNVVIYAKPGVQKQSWYDGLYVELPHVQTWTASECQDLCLANPACQYFHVSEEHCYLKADYTEQQKDNNGGCLPLYQAFDVVRPFDYASGPKECMHPHDYVTCGELKHSYRQGLCCGNSAGKKVEMH